MSSYINIFDVNRNWLSLSDYWDLGELLCIWMKRLFFYHSWHRWNHGNEICFNMGYSRSWQQFQNLNWKPLGRVDGIICMPLPPPPIPQASSSCRVPLVFGLWDFNFDASWIFKEEKGELEWFLWSWRSWTLKGFLMSTFSKSQLRSTWSTWWGDMACTTSVTLSKRLVPCSWSRKLCTL